MQIHRDNWQQLSGSNERLLPRQVYRIIGKLGAIPTVRRQVDSIKRSRQLKMASDERHLPRHLVRNTIFNQFTGPSE
jgi:hypothetical protein